MIWKKIWPTKDFVILRIDLKVNFGRKMRGPDTAGSDLKSQLDLHFFMNSLNAVSFSLGALAT